MDLNLKNWQATYIYHHIHFTLTVLVQFLSWHSSMKKYDEAPLLCVCVLPTDNSASGEEEVIDSWPWLTP